MIPHAGSAYTYTYATMGRFMAWFIGWNMVLEYRRLRIHAWRWAGRAISSICCAVRDRFPRRLGQCAARGHRHLRSCI